MKARSFTSGAGVVATKIFNRVRLQKALTNHHARLRGSRRPAPQALALQRLAAAGLAQVLRVCDR
jgi:hypothetical protein